jgi:hypothetical protein
MSNRDLIKEKMKKVKKTRHASKSFQCLVDFPWIQKIETKVLVAKV